MNNKQKKKLNFKSESGATMTDIVLALMIITMFAGLIGGIFYTSFKVIFQSRVTELATSYAINILEDVDKISYEEVVNGMENDYINRLEIPEMYNLSIQVSNYDAENGDIDLIKNVKLIISYDFAGNNEEIIINKMKIKEI